MRIIRGSDKGKHPSSFITNLCKRFFRSPLEPNPFPESCLRLSRNREAAMRLLTIILASATAATALTSAALAEQAMQGVVTQINRLNNTIAIQQTQSGTVGANTGGM